MRIYVLNLTMIRYSFLFWKKKIICEVLISIFFFSESNSTALSPILYQGIDVGALFLGHKAVLLGALGMKFKHNISIHINFFFKILK